MGQSTIFINTREIAEPLNAYLLPFKIEYTEKKESKKDKKSISYLWDKLGRNGFLKDTGTEKHLKKYGPKLSKLMENYKLTDPGRLTNPKSAERKLHQLTLK